MRQADISGTHAQIFMPEISHNVYLHLQYVWFYNTNKTTGISDNPRETCDPERGQH